MPDNRVAQPAKGMCLVTSAACCAEVMSGLEVTADISAKHAQLVKDGLAVSMEAGVEFAKIYDALEVAGMNGFEVKDGITTGIVYLVGPYPIEFDNMISGLRNGSRPYIMFYKLEDGTGHADCITGIDESFNLIAADAVNTAPDASTQIISTKWVRDRVYACYAYDHHIPRLNPTAYDEWRAAKLAAGELPTSGDDFQAHVNTMADSDGGSRDIYERGFPQPPTPATITIVEPPAIANPDSGAIAFAGKTQFMGIQVWQRVPPATVAALCSRTGLNSVCVKALDGTFWMGGISQYNPDGPASVAAMRDFYHSIGLQFGVWTNPLSSVDLKQQVDMTVEAASNADYLVLDIEPYAPDFWGANNKVGLAEEFCVGLRQGLGFQYPIAFQPDPRTARLNEIRAEEWIPYMSAWMSQHYYIDFKDTPELEANDAVGKRSLYMPNRALCPTFPVRNDSDPNDLATAVDIIKRNAGAGFMIWRDTLCSDLSAMAAVKAFTS